MLYGNTAEHKKVQRGYVNLKTDMYLFNMMLCWYSCFKFYLVLLRMSEQAWYCQQWSVLELMM